jgi:hypothetical protein
MGEGAGALVLETEAHAKARGAKIYAELVGGAVTSDAHHITAPDPEGTGAARAVIAALKQAEAKPEEVVHINAHATSTPVGDIAEYTALHKVFGDRIKQIPVSATKSATGHLLGGTGALEAMFTVLSAHEKIAAPTLNLDNQDEAIPLDVVVELVADPEVVIERIRLRATEQGRADDTEDVVRNRLEVYARETAPLIEVYGGRDILVSVDGIGSIDDVTARILDALAGRGFRA